MKKQIKQGQLIAIEWIDACSSKDVHQYDLFNRKLKEHLAINISIGAFYKKNKDAIIIINEKSNTGNYDITTIPTKNIISIKYK